MNAAASSLNAAFKSSTDQLCQERPVNVSPWSFHSAAPSSRPNTYGACETMSNPTDGRNFGPLTTGQEQTRANLQRKFDVHFPDRAKTTAKRTGLSPETVDLYKQVNVPKAWARFAEVCKANPAFAIDILEDLGISIDQDRNSYALFLSLQRAVRGE